MFARLLLLILFVVPVLVEAQSPAVNQFYRKHKRDEGMMNAKLPGWLVKLGVGIARPFVKDEEAKIALKVARKVGKTKFMIAEDECRVSQGEYMNLINAVKKDGFDPLIQVRDGDENVTIMSKESRGILRNLLIIVREEDSFVMLSMKTRLKIDDLGKMINDFMRHEKEKKAAKEKKAEEPAKPMA